MPRVIDNRTYFTASEIAKFFDVRRRAVYHWAERGPHYMGPPIRRTDAPSRVLWPAANVLAFAMEPCRPVPKDIVKRVISTMTVGEIPPSVLLDYITKELS